LFSSALARIINTRILLTVFHPHQQTYAILITHGEEKKSPCSKVKLGLFILGRFLLLEMAKSVLLICFLGLVFAFAAADNSPLQDFCVAEAGSSGNQCMLVTE